MHLNAITIPIEIELTDKSRVLLDALMQSLKGAAPPSPPAEPSVMLQPPRIGDLWPEQCGIYAGVSRGEDGAPDAHLVLLEARPTEELNWSDAAMWAHNFRDGARLPTRFESALLYANLRDKIDTAGWYWTSTQYSSNYAWMQYFSYGTQDDGSKSSTARAVAVRRLVL